MGSLEHDMICLVDSLQYLKDDTHQQVQALEHLSDMCLQDKGGYLFQKIGGLSVVLKMLFDKNQNQLVLQKSLLTLGNATLINNENKVMLNTDLLLNHIKSTMLNKDATHKLIAASSYFLACLCSGNEKAQNKARKCKCLESLVMLYRYFHPKGNTSESSLDEQWFEKADSHPPIILSHISHALKAMICKPTNKENQLLCSKLLNLAINSLMSGHNVSKVEALCLISDCVYENEKTLQIFKMVGGIRCLAQIFKHQLDDAKEDIDLLASVLDTLSVVFTDCTPNKDCASEMGIINSLVKCLQIKSTHNIQLKGLICLAECVHENEKCQRAFLQCNGIPVVIGLMSTKQDEIISKVGMTVLHSCVINLSDFTVNNLPFSKMEMSAGFEEQKNISKQKSFKAVVNGNNKDSDKVASFIKENFKNVSKKPNKSNEETIKIVLPNSQITQKKSAKAKLSCEQEMMGLLIEQKEMMQNFQKDFYNLRAEINISDLSSSNLVCDKVNHKPIIEDCIRSTPTRKPHVFSTTAIRNVQPSVSENITPLGCYTEKMFHDNIWQATCNAPVEKGSLVRDERPALIVEQDISIISSQQTANKNQNNEITSAFEPSVNVVEKVQKWRQACPTPSFYASTFEDSKTNINKVTDSHFENQFKVPKYSITEKKSSSDFHETPLAQHQSHGSITPLISVSRKPIADIQCAPKKPPFTKRRRLMTLNYIEPSYTPEHKTSLSDSTKRTLNFTQFSSLERLNFNNCDQDLKFQSWADESESIPVILKVSEKKIFVTQCIACNPFNWQNFISANSRNLYSLLKQNDYTCIFHGEFMKRYMSWKNDALFSFKCDSSNVTKLTLKSLPVRKNISLIERDVKKVSIVDEDEKSLCSNWTSLASNYQRRVRQDYSKEEIDYILKGVERYGTRWTAILNTYPFKNGRQATDIRGKYKQMKKQNLL